MNNQTIKFLINSNGVYPRKCELNINEKKLATKINDKIFYFLLTSIKNSMLDNIRIRINDTIYGLSKFIPNLLSVTPIGFGGQARLYSFQNEALKIISMSQPTVGVPSNDPYIYAINYEYNTGVYFIGGITIDKKHFAIGISRNGEDITWTLKDYNTTFFHDDFILYTPVTIPSLVEKSYLWFQLRHQNQETILEVREIVINDSDKVESITFLKQEVIGNEGTYSSRNTYKLGACRVNGEIAPCIKKTNSNGYTYEVKNTYSACILYNPRDLSNTKLIERLVPLSKFCIDNFIFDNVDEETVYDFYSKSFVKMENDQIIKIKNNKIEILEDFKGFAYNFFIGGPNKCIPCD